MASTIGVGDPLKDRSTALLAMKEMMVAASTGSPLYAGALYESSKALLDPTQTTLTPEEPKPEHALHDDMGLHDFRSMYAELADGRRVEIGIDADGHPQIIGIISEPSSPPPLPAYETPMPIGGGKPRDGLSDSFEPGGGLEHKLDSISPPPENPDAEVIEPQIRDNVFLARLSSVMNDNQFDRQLRGRTRGKLDMTRLYKAQAGSKSLFTQKSLRRNKKYNVVLVVDESGSMDGAKIKVAADATVFLAHHLRMVKGVELAIVGFNHHLRNYQEFGQTADLSTLGDKIRSQTASVAGACNADYAALERAYELVEKQAVNGGQNIVLFTSDGAPDTCSSCVGGPLRNGKRVDDMAVINGLVRKNERLTNTFGIGIMSDASQTPKRVVVGDLAELKPAVLRILQKEIRRG